MEIHRSAFSPEQREAIRARRPLRSAALIGYITRGGTYVIASRGEFTDSGHPGDLAVILPGDLGAGQVLSLYIATSPDLIDELTKILED